MRCEKHGLALGPDGTCVVCRRESEARGARSGVWRAVGWAALALCVGGLVIMGGDFAGLWHVHRAVLSPETTEIAPVAEEPSTEAPADGELEEPTLDPSEDEIRSAETPEPLALEDPDPFPDAPAAPTLAPPGVVEPPAPSGPTQSDLERALSEVQIELYATSWCPHCTRARAWFRANGFRYVEHDVETDSSANRRQRQLNPKGTVPTIDIDGIVLVGFGEANTAKAIRIAAQRRADSAWQKAHPGG